MTATVSSPSPRSAPSPDADSGRPSSRAVFFRLIARSAPPWRQLALAMGLGVAAAATTIGLLAGSGALVDKAAFQPGLAAIAGLLAVVEVLAFIRAPLRYAERLVGHDAAFHALSRWRVWLYDSLEPLAPAGLRAWRSGDLLVRAVDDVDALQDLYLRVLTPVVVAVATSVLAVVVVALILPLAGLLLGVALAVALLVPPGIVLATRSTAERVASLRGSLAADVVELVQGAPELLAFGRHEDYLARADGADAELARLARRRSSMAAVTSAIVALCVGGAVIGTLASGVDALSHHHLEPIMLAVLPFAAVAAFETVPGVTVAAARLREVLAAGRRLLDLEDVPAPVHEPELPVALEGDAAVALHDARLRYGADLPWALDGCDLAVASGGRVAIVGASGAGKSSIVNALLRFWPLEQGDATLGGVDIASAASEEVRRAMALVAQEADLFAGTIASNVALARPRADREEIERALRLAQLEAWVHTLPDGVDTPVGERGERLSGGQRQRVALARALLAGGRVLLLDEPTAGLDEPTAAALIADVLAATEGTTVILVTHRSADLAGFSDVVEIEAGRARPR